MFADQCGNNDLLQLLPQVQATMQAHLADVDTEETLRITRRQDKVSEVLVRPNVLCRPVHHGYISEQVMLPSMYDGKFKANEDYAAKIDGVLDPPVAKKVSKKGRRRKARHVSRDEEDGPAPPRNRNATAAPKEDLSGLTGVEAVARPDDVDAARQSNKDQSDTAAADAASDPERDSAATKLEDDDEDEEDVRP